MPEWVVFTITNDPEVATWLHSLNAVPYLPQGGERAIGGMPLGAYRRAKDGQLEWDFYIHTVDVEGEESIWEAAGKVGKTVEPTEFA